MQSHRLLYNKNNIIILTLVLIPILGTGLLMYLLLLLPENTPDWIIYSAITVGLLIIVALVLWIVLKKINIPCTVIVDEKGISYRLEKKSLFYRYHDFFAGWENVTSISETYDNKTGKPFYQIGFKNPSFTANFSALKNEDEDADIFYQELSYYRDLYNLNHLNSPITSKNFYQNGWARLLTWLFYLMTVAVIYFQLFSGKGIDWWRTITFFSFGIVWIGNYYRNTKKLY